jgi:RNA polymerase sigma factor (sigma-70 family)
MEKRNRGLMDVYLEKNYEKDMDLLKVYINKYYYGKFNTGDVSDIYHDSIVKCLESDSYKGGLIKNINGFLWVVIQNKLVELSKKKKTDLVFTDANIGQTAENIVNHDDSFYNDIGFNILMQDIKDELTNQEYWILINHIYNNITYKQISNIIGYSHQYVYEKRSVIREKIKKIIKRNGEKYF